MCIDYTALALVVDRSGSMHSIANDVVGSVKQFIGDQKKNPAKASLTVVQFDHTYEVIHDFEDIQSVDDDKFTKNYSPRGTTALLDAIGRTVFDMKKKIESQACPTKNVVIAIITDGLENASTEYTLEKIKGLIKEHEALGWNFMFLGATLDAINVAQSMGFSSSKSAVYEVGNVKQSFQVIGAKMTDARNGTAININDKERDQLVAQ